jgi:hypothetical protein
MSGIGRPETAPAARGQLGSDMQTGPRTRGINGLSRRVGAELAPSIAGDKRNLDAFPGAAAATPS